MSLSSSNFWWPFFGQSNGVCCRMEAHTRTKWQDDEKSVREVERERKGREGDCALTRKKNITKTVSVHYSEGFSLSGLMPWLLMEIGSHNSPRLRLTNPRIFISKNNGMENHSPCSMSCSNTYGVQRCRRPKRVDSIRDRVKPSRDGSPGRD